MDNKITIIKSPTADSRTANGPVDVDTLKESTISHQNDVKKSYRLYCRDDQRKSRTSRSYKN